MRYIPVFTDEEFKRVIQDSNIGFSDAYELLKNKFTKDELHNILNLRIRDLEKRADVFHIFKINVNFKTDEHLNKEIKDIYLIAYMFGVRYEDIASALYLSARRAHEYVFAPEKIKSRHIKIQVRDYMRSELQKRGVFI